MTTFKDFLLKSSSGIANGDYLVGYSADGSVEFRATLSDILPTISDPVSPDQFNVQLQNAGLAAIAQKDLGIRQMVNVGRHTEDLGWSAAVVATPSTLITGTPATINAMIGDRLMTLTGLTPTSFNSNLQHRYSNAALTPFAAGVKYLVSYYAYAPNDTYFYMRSVASTASEGHGIRGVRRQRVKRVWTLFQATSQTMIDPGVSAEVALGSGTGVQPQFYQAGLPGTQQIFINGFQIEAVAPTTKNGIMVTGDSTVAGNSGKIDTCYDFTNPENAQWSTWLSIALNCDVYNRGVGGQTMTSMLARWDTDMTPLAANSAYCIIQGGINDVNQGHTLAQMQSDVQGMVAKAIANGFVMNGIVGTIRIIAVQPTGYFTGDLVKEPLRLAYNAWLKLTYGSAVIDYSSVVQNPWTTAHDSLHPAYFQNETPNVHPNGIGREAVANFIALNGGFSLLPTPSAYQRQQA